MDNLTTTSVTPVLTSYYKSYNIIAGLNTYTYTLT